MAIDKDQKIGGYDPNNLPDDIKRSQERSFQRMVDSIEDFTQCEGCRCEDKITRSEHYTDDDVGFCSPCWISYLSDLLKEVESGKTIDVIALKDVLGRPVALDPQYETRAAHKRGWDACVDHIHTNGFPNTHRS